jgi:hypothetical protein
MCPKPRGAVKATYDTAPLGHSQFVLYDSFIFIKRTWHIAN